MFVECSDAFAACFVLLDKYIRFVFMLDWMPIGQACKVIRVTLDPKKTEKESYEVQTLPSVD